MDKKDDKRDQRAYDLFQKYRFTVVLFVVTRIAGMMDAPYRIKPSVSGPRGYPPRAMGVIVFMMEELHLTYRGMVGYLNEHRQTLQKLGLNKVPSKSTIHRASARMPESYYRQMHFRVITGIAAGSLAGDSSGFSIRRFIPWYSIKKDIEKLKKGWRKLHIIIDIRTPDIIGASRRVNPCYNKGACPRYARLQDHPNMKDRCSLRSRDSRLHGFSLNGDAHPDFAYLPRITCNTISGMGGTPPPTPSQNPTPHPNHVEVVSGG